MKLHRNTRPILAALLLAGLTSGGYAQEQQKATMLSKPAELSADADAAKSKVSPLGSDDKVAPLGAEKKAVAPLGAAMTKTAPLGSEKVAAAVPLGKPSKPKFALKNTAPTAGAAAPDRAAEIERLIDAYRNIAIRYADRMVLASTEEEIAAAKRHEPSARALRPIVRLIAEVIAVDPTDEPALDGLLFVSKYVGVPLIDETLAKAVFEDGTRGVDANALILEHHADNPKLAAELRLWPKSPETDDFLLGLFEKTHSPKVRAAAGIRLINSLQKHDQEDYAEHLAEVMASDHYLDGVPITTRPTGPTAREWAEGKLREIRFVSVGNVLPEVTGAKLSGETEKITDYRGKVVILDVWTTWCGPCVAMIPHQNEMVERFRDKPFALISVSCDSQRSTLEQFLETKPMPWNHWWVGTDSELQDTLNVRSFPSVIVLDAEGVIRHKNIKDEELEEAVEALLTEMEESTDAS